MSQHCPTWTIAIFTARETLETLMRSVRAALAACTGKQVALDILVNGNEALATAATVAIAEEFNHSHEHAIRVWYIGFGDKAHAWNDYVHKIWSPSDIAFFIDGYTEVRADSFSRLAEGLGNDIHSLGATGVPTSGRTAAAVRNQMVKHGGFHGNLNAIRGEVMSALRAQMIRLPIGLYRTDSLIGAFLSFKLDPANYSWDPKRIVVQADATWDVQAGTWWLPKNLKVHLKRRMRQAQGALENLAAREHLAIGRRSPASLPRTINELVTTWVDADPRRATRLFIKNPLSFYAAKKFRQPRDWSQAEKPPKLLFEANRENLSH